MESTLQTEHTDEISSLNSYSVDTRFSTVRTLTILFGLKKCGIKTLPNMPIIEFPKQPEFKIC